MCLKQFDMCLLELKREKTLTGETSAMELLPDVFLFFSLKIRSVHSFIHGEGSCARGHGAQGKETVACA